MTPHIRPAEPNDRHALYEVCLRTGDAGEDATDLFDDPTLLGEVFVGPYLMLDSGIGFAAVDESGPAGYALAAPDTRRFEAECEAKWWPNLRTRYRDPGPNPTNAPDEVLSMIHHPQLAADNVVAEYPAHLHLDLLPRLQGKGVGRMIMERLLDELTRLEARGVHLEADARNLRAIGFYEHLGFTTIEMTRETVTMGTHLGHRG